MRTNGKIHKGLKYKGRRRYLISFDVDYVDSDEWDYLRDKEIEITISEREKRTLKQNSTFWHCMTALAGPAETKWDKYLECLRKYSKSYECLCVDNDAVDALKMLYREIEVVGECYVFRDGKPHEMTEIFAYRGISKMTKNELSALIDGVVNEMVGAGLEPPAPSYIEEFINQNEKYYSN